MIDAHQRGDLLGLRTSGTSGRPRAVVRTTASWFDSFEHVTRLLGMGSASRVWVPGPLSATMNLFAAVHAAQVGAAVDASSAGATHAVLTPAALSRALAQAGLTAKDVDHLFFVTVTGFLAEFDYQEEVDRVVIDLTESHIWDGSAVAAIDKVVLRFRRRGIAVDNVLLHEETRRLMIGQVPPPDGVFFEYEITGLDSPA